MSINKNVSLNQYTKATPRGMLCFPDMLQADESVPDEYKNYYKGERSPYGNSGVIETYYLGRYDSPVIFFIRALQTYELNYIAELAKNTDFFSKVDSYSLRLLENIHKPIVNSNILEEATQAYSEKIKNMPEQAIFEYRYDLLTAVCGVERLGTLNQYKAKEWLQTLIESGGCAGDWDKKEIEEFDVVDFPMAALLFSNESVKLKMLTNKIWELTTGGHLYVEKKPVSFGVM